MLCLAIYRRADMEEEEGEEGEQEDGDGEGNSEKVSLFIGSRIFKC